MKNTNSSRHFAITDIHGCLQSFQALLEKIKLSKRDYLYLLGDYVNRGPDSKGVIDHIWKLQDEGFFIHCIRGNHEERVLSNYGSYYLPGLFPKQGTEKFNRSFAIKNAGEIPKKYVDWFQQLPAFLKIDGYILVHAGLDFNTENPLRNQKAMLWIRNWYDNINYHWTGKNIILHGHSPIGRQQMEANLQLLEQRQVLNLDCGCVVQNKADKGFLAAFDLDKKVLVFQKCLDNPKS